MYTHSVVWLAQDIFGLCNFTLRKYWSGIEHVLKWYLRPLYSHILLLQSPAVHIGIKSRAHIMSP